VVRCKTLLEFIEELKVVFGAVNSKESQRFFIQRQDETWCEKVDIESLDEVLNRDKLFLICSTITNTSQTESQTESQTDEKVKESFGITIIFYIVGVN